MDSRSLRHKGNQKSWLRPSHTSNTTARISTGTTALLHNRRKQHSDPAQDVSTSEHLRRPHLGNRPYVTAISQSVRSILTILGPNNAFLVKRKAGGGVQFSRDPFNLVNKHSRTHAGFVNSKAVSVQANGSKGVVLQTKRAGKANTPKSAANANTFKAGRSSRS